MHYIQIAPVLFFIRFTLVIADPPAAVSRRGLPGGLYLCSEPDWRGSCKWYHPDKTAKCITLTGPEAHTFGPDSGGYCRIFTGPKCEGNVGSDENGSK